MSTLCVRVCVDRQRHDFILDGAASEIRRANWCLEGVDEPMDLQGGRQGDDHEDRRLRSCERG